MLSISKKQPGRKQLLAASIIAATMTVGVFADASDAQAAFTLTFTQVGADVVAVGTGSIDTSSFTLTNSALPTTVSEVNGSTGLVILGQQKTVNSLPVFSGTGVVYSGLLSDSLTFGSGTAVVPDAASGQIVGILATGGYIYLPTGYVSNTQLGVTATWDNSTFASLGLDQGTYTETFGTDPNIDTFTVQIGDTPPPPLLLGSPVPEPASMALVGAGILGLVAMRRRRRV